MLSPNVSIFRKESALLLALTFLLYLATMPASTYSGNTAVKFTFRRTSKSAYLAPAAEYATDPSGAWLPASNGISGLVVVTTTNVYDAGGDTQVNLPGRA